MSKTAEQILKANVAMRGGVVVHGKIEDAMNEFAAQEVAKELESYKYALKAELQSRVNGTRGLEHLSFEDISEIIDTVNERTGGFRANRY